MASPASELGGDDTFEQEVLDFIDALKYSDDTEISVGEAANGDNKGISPNGGDLEEEAECRSNGESSPTAEDSNAEEEEETECRSKGESSPTAADSSLDKEGSSAKDMCWGSELKGAGASIEPCTKGFVIQSVEILAHRPWRGVRIGIPRGPILGIAGVLFLDVGTYQTGVHGKPFAANKPFRHATRNRHLEHMTQQVTLAEPAMPVLGKGRMIRKAVGQLEAAEPAIGEVQMYLFAKASF